MTLEEALEASVQSNAEDNEVIVIDNDLRKITIPASITLLGVESDENVRTLHFQMPKTYKGLDLSEFAIRINYMNANNVGDTYAVDDSEISGENIVFTWTVGRAACMYKGNTKFIVCLKKKDASGNVLKEFNTSLTSLPVLEGLETTEAVVAENPDIIEQILTKIEKLTQISPEDIASAVSNYMEANPINVPKNLSDLKEDDEHETVTKEEKQAWNAKSDFSGEYRDLRGKPELAEWALQSKKPTYTAEEVGALPDTTEIPKNLSDLQDDAEHRTVTDKEKQSWNDKSDFSGNYEDLQGKPTIPTIPTVPTKLPNPQALAITYGGQTHTYDGSEAIAITIETGGIERVEKLSTDTTVTLEPNKLYIFPEMASLTYTLAEPADASVANEYHFVFKSGSTATELVHPSTVNVGNFSIDANKVYEVSILEGLLTSQSWAVS